MHRLFRASRRQHPRMDRLRRVTSIALTVAFATFVSVANATAEEAVPTAPQPTGEVVVLVPVEQPAADAAPAPAPAPAPAAEPAPDPVPAEQRAPAPVVDAAPAAVAPAPVPAVQAAAIVQDDAEVVMPPAKVAVAVEEGPKSIVAAAGPGSYDKVVRVAGVWTVSNSVRICHATSGQAAYSFTTPPADADSVLGNGNDHGSHVSPNFGPDQATVGDIIEAFSYVRDHNGGSIDDADVLSYAGRNLGTVDTSAGATWESIIGATAPAGLTGQAILDGGCAAPAAAVDPTCVAPLIDFDPAAGVADCRPAKPVVPATVSVCNAEGGGVYSAQTWTVTGDVTTDHGAHPDDVIPPFSYVADHTWNGTGWVAVPQVFAGRNYGSSVPVSVPFFGGLASIPGAVLLDVFGCFAGPFGPPIVITCPAGTSDFDAGPALDCRPPMPAIANKRVQVCHAAGDGTFRAATWKIRNGDVAAGHGAHQGDIIPGFRYVTGWTWDAATGAWVKQFARFPARNTGTIQTTITFPIIGAVTFNLVGQDLLDTGCVTPVAPKKPKVQPTRVSFCHATNGSGSGFNRLITTSSAALFRRGHDGHANDIIPQFDYTTGYTYSAATNSWIATTATFPGRNDDGPFIRKVTFPQTGRIDWTIDGAAIAAKLAAGTAVAADCGIGQPTAKPTVQPMTVPVCHATSVGGFDTYEADTWTITNAQVVGFGHDQDVDDIIGSFDYVVDFAYDNATHTWKPVEQTYAGKNNGTFTRAMTLPDVGTIQWTIDGANALGGNDCVVDMPTAKPAITATPVTMCHAATVAGFDTYVALAGTSDDVLAAGGHDSEADDIIPAFTYTTGFTFDPATDTWTAVTSTYPGKNLGTHTRSMNLPVGAVTRSLNGADMLANGCMLPQLPARPDLVPTPVTMCHAGTVNGIDGYTLVNTDHRDVVGVAGHDADPNDVIPSFTYTTGHTYDYVTDTWVPTTATYAGKNLGTFVRTVALAIGPATLTFDGTAMLASGTCAMPSGPTDVDTTPDTADTPGAQEPTDATPTDETPTDAGGPGDVAGEDAAPVEPEGVAAAEDDALPFTGVQLGALLLIGLGAVGAGSVLHAGRRRRATATPHA